MKRCPICHRLPELRLDGRFWMGGCAEHLADVVLQPFDMFEQCEIQWNTVVDALQLEAI